MSDKDKPNEPDDHDAPGQAGQSGASGDPTGPGKHRDSGDAPDHGHDHHDHRDDHGDGSHTDDDAHTGHSAAPGSSGKHDHPSRQQGPAGDNDPAGPGDDDFDGRFDASFGEFGDNDLDDDFDGRFGEGPFDPLDEREAALVEQDLNDLADFEAAFAAEGYRGVAVWCHDCAEEHYYPWDMLRENLTLLLQTGEAPVHEPAFNPEPARYVPWDYARGYVDALRDAGLADRQPVGICPRCTLDLTEIADANFCPRCGSPLLGARIAEALTAAGIDDETVTKILGAIGLPRPSN